MNIDNITRKTLYSHIQTLCLPISASDHFKITVISFGVQFTISPNDCHNCFPGYVIKPLQCILNAAAPLLNFPKYFHIISLLHRFPIPAKINSKHLKIANGQARSYILVKEIRLPCIFISIHYKK